MHFSLSMTCRPLLCFGFGSLLLLLLSYLFWTDSVNKCQMTYMYQWPEFIEIPLNKSFKSNYRLIVYGEGTYAATLRVAASAQKPTLRGFPVLFIPGNAGSYRQVRSLGSVSLMKTAARAKKKPQFNYFAIDTQEELCGLYGEYLWRQTDFVARAIERIFELYIDKDISIILVGHSMGGLVARGVFTRPKFNPKRVLAVLTLATPHMRPTLDFDAALVEYVEMVNEWWIKEAKNSLSHLVALSVAGGTRDILVRSDLTRWPAQLRQNNGGVSLFEHSAPALPFVWASTDHLCIVWCNQLVRLLSRFLFDLFDEPRGRLTSNRRLRADILAYHFGNNLGSNSYHSRLIRLPKNLTAQSLTVKNLRVLMTTMSSETLYYRVSVTQEMLGQKVFLLTDQNVPTFVYYSNDSLSEWNALKTQDILPPNQRSMHIEFNQNWQGKQLILALRYDSPRRFLLYKVYRNISLHTDRLELGITNLLNPFWRYERNFSGSLAFYNLSIDNFGSFLRSFAVSLRPWKCDQYEKESMSVVHFRVESHPTLSLYRHFRYPFDREDVLHIHLHSVPSPVPSVSLDLYFNPGCSYIFTIDPQPLRAFVNLLQQFVHLLPKLLAVDLLCLIFIRQWMKDSSFWSPAYIVLLILVWTGFRCINTNGCGQIDLESWVALCIVCVFVLSAAVAAAHLFLQFFTAIRRSILFRLRRPSDSHSEEVTDVKKAAFVCGFGCITVYFFCGAVVVVVSAVRHIWICSRRRNELDSVFLVCEALILALCGPAGIVWLTNLVTDGLVQLDPDPSRLAAFILVTFSFLSAFVADGIRLWSLLPLIFGCLMGSNYLPTLATFMCAAVAVCRTQELEDKQKHA